MTKKQVRLPRRGKRLTPFERKILKRTGKVFPRVLFGILKVMGNSSNFDCWLFLEMLMTALAPIAERTVSASDLPLFCPPANTPLWSQHPRVFLDIEHTRQAQCPYCSTPYRLIDSPQSSSTHQA